MPKPNKPIEKRCLSGFMLMRQHKNLLAEKQVKDARVKELTSVKNDARGNAIASGKKWDKEQRDLGTAESRLVFINRAITRIEKELSHQQS